MPRFSTEQLCTEWTAINQRFSAEVQQFVIDFSQQHASSLSEHFYREMPG